MTKVITAVQLITCLLVVAVFSLSFNLWVIHYVYKSAVLLTQEKAEKIRRMSSGHERNDVLCPCVFKKYSTIEYTLGVTLATIGCFCICGASQITSMSTYLATCTACKDFPGPVGWIQGLWSLSFSFGYILMFVTQFERLRLSFANTSQRMPKWAPKVLYVAVIIATALCLMQYIFLYTVEWMSGACIVVLIALYSVSVSVMIVTFYRRIMDVALSGEKSDVELVDTAVRIVVCVVISLVSTVLCYASLAASQFVCPKCLLWILIRNTNTHIDIGLNSFCLMCTFRRAKPRYMLVFGRLHRYLLLRLEHRTSKTESQSAIAIAIEQGKGTPVPMSIMRNATVQQSYDTPIGPELSQMVSN